MDLQRSKMGVVNNKSSITLQIPVSLNRTQTDGTKVLYDYFAIILLKTEVTFFCCLKYVFLKTKHFIHGHLNDSKIFLMQIQYGNHGTTYILNFVLVAIWKLECSLTYINTDLQIKC